MSLISTYETPWIYEAEGDIVDTLDTRYSLVAQSIITGHYFPSSIEVGKSASWNIEAHNNGTEGIYGIGVSNESGNPGSIIIYREGKEYNIPPGRYFRTSTVGAVPYCTSINVDGEVTIPTVGTYNIRLFGLHLENGVWTIDDQRTISVRTSEPGPAEWPVTEPIHVFDNVLLKAEWWDAWKEKSRTVINIDTSLLVGGKLDYRIKYMQGVPLAEVVKIAFDGKEIVSERLTKGESKTGTIDLTGLIERDATIKISFESFPGFWSEVLFDIWLNLGFSEKPPVPPREKAEWIEWIEKNGKWVALGVTGLAVLYMMRRPAMPIIVIPGGGK